MINNKKKKKTFQVSNISNTNDDTILKRFITSKGVVIGQTTSYRNVPYNSPKLSTARYCVRAFCRTVIEGRLRYMCK